MSLYEDEDWNNWEYEQLGVICVDLKHLAWILDNLLCTVEALERVRPLTVGSFDSGNGIKRQMVVCKQTTYVSYGLYEDGAYYNGMRVFQLLQMDTMLMTKYSGGKER
ncbi:hypothetical protein Tco_1202320 [Tanacetum coccineum]